VSAGIRELDERERQQARTLLSKLARERRLSAKDREKLKLLAKMVAAGAAKGARPGGLPKRR
jgi:hypothetical protein